MDTDLRRELGAAGERLAEKHLNEAGYRVIDRNYRTRHGELDLVAISRGTLVFCEVKSRMGTRPCALALEMIGPGKRRQVRSMAREWLAARAPLLGSWNGQEIRFDAIGVTIGPDGLPIAVDHVPDAF